MQEKISYRLSEFLTAVLWDTVKYLRSNPGAIPGMSLCQRVKNIKVVSLYLSLREDNLPELPKVE